MKNKWIIATRKSKLALWQANFVKQAIEQRYPHCHVSLLEIVTEGDREQTQSLAAIGGKANFVKALQEALITEKADFAVHSMKDMSVYPSPQLCIAAVIKRADPRDVFLSRHYATVEDLPPHAIVGTASPRRQCLIKASRPDITIKLLRGNVDTRLAKLLHGEYDAIVLAAAGLARLGVTAPKQNFLSEDFFTPAIAQGALAIECREDDHNTQEMLRFMHDTDTGYCVTAERAVNQLLGGDCHTAVGAFAKIVDQQLFLQAMIGSENGETILRATLTGNPTDAQSLGESVAKHLISQGANKLVELP